MLASKGIAVGSMSTDMIWSGGRCAGKEGGLYEKEGSERVDSRGRNSRPPYRDTSATSQANEIDESEEAKKQTHSNITTDISNALTATFHNVHHDRIRVICVRVRDITLYGLTQLHYFL